jgi:hypothetical protein
MHRYQVAKYVIFDSEKIFVKRKLFHKYFGIQGKFYKNLKNQKFSNAVVEKIVFVFRAQDDCFVGAFE